MRFLTEEPDVLLTRPLDRSTETSSASLESSEHEIQAMIAEKVVRVAS